MLEQHHPQGAARAPGCRLSWLLESEVFGTLGGMSFVAAPMRLGPRDKWLGWSDRARGAHIARIVSQDRFLLLPGVRVKHLASRALMLAREALPAAWKQRHGLEPLLLETCVDGAHSGTCYKAAGWQQVGRTQGCPPGHAGAVEPKQVFVLELGKQQGASREKLRAEPPRELGCWPLPPASASFAEREFGRSDLPDGRLRRRLLGLAAALGQRLASSPRCCWRQDATSLNWTRLKDCTQGLGPLKERSSSARWLRGFEQARCGDQAGLLVRASGSRR